MGGLGSPHARHPTSTRNGSSSSTPAWALDHLQRQVRSCRHARALALAAGFLAGLLAGHLIMWHQKALLLSHLYVSGALHRNQFLHSESLPGSFSSSSTSRSSGISSDRLPGSWSETTSSSTVGGSLPSSSSSSSSSLVVSSSSSSSIAASSSQKGQARFIRGSGQRSSFLYSTSSATGLTAADAQRISKVLKQRASELPGDSIHALLTGNGSPYQNIQSRIMYSSLKLTRKMPGGQHITAFTRIMHRTTDDDLVGEFPTFRAYPLQPECDTWCEFPVKDRPNAVVQWLLAAEQHPEMIQGAWLLLLESDYVWMKPLQLPGSAHDLAVQGYGFEFDYIDPAFPDAAKVMLEMCPECNVQQIPKSGPAPVLLRPHELALIGPDWERYTAWIEGNDNAKKVLGWVREMYAWDVAVHKNGVRLQHQAPPRSRLISQPPHNFEQGQAAMLHYTWGTLLFEGGKEVWRFDKRDWTAKEHELKVPQFTLPPQPWKDGWKLQDGVPVNRALHQLTTDMLKQMNRASALLPVLPPTSRQ